MTEIGALLNERENEKFFCLPNSVGCIATVIAEWSLEWETEVPDLSQPEKSSQKLSSGWKKNHKEDLHKRKVSLTALKREHRHDQPLRIIRRYGERH